VSPEGGNEEEETDDKADDQRPEVDPVELEIHEGVNVSEAALEARRRVSERGVRLLIAVNKNATQISSIVLTFKS
jgi:hypothetical protein